jgi:TonB family protein
MRVRKIAILLASMLVAAMIPRSFAGASDDVEEQLKADYLGKVLTLRHFYKGKQLVFEPGGSLIGFADVGPWTVDGQVLVESIELQESKLQIHARRICLVFDSKGKASRDVLSFLAESKAKDREALEGVFRANEVDFDIGLASEKPDMAAVSSAMNAVFLKPGESMRDIVPDFWRDYFDGVDGLSREVRHSAEPVYGVGPNGASAPHVTYQGDPQFSEEARQAKYQGVMIVSLVVDPSGSVRDLAIVSPLGMGLDENAIAAVGAWKFEPGIKDGNPVPVQLKVEVDFRLY